MQGLYYQQQGLGFPEVYNRLGSTRLRVQPWIQAELLCVMRRKKVGVSGADPGVSDRQKGSCAIKCRETPRMDMAEKGI